jgi:hypothetical protein
MGMRKVVHIVKTNPLASLFPVLRSCTLYLVQNVLMESDEMASAQKVEIKPNVTDFAEVDHLLAQRAYHLVASHDVSQEEIARFSRDFINNARKKAERVIENLISDTQD